MLRAQVARQARVTLPARMQEVHTFNRLGVRPTRARTVWILGFQRRGVRRWEWEMLLPKPGPLPQTSQVAATVHSLGITGEGRVRLFQPPKVSRPDVMSNRQPPGRR